MADEILMGRSNREHYPKAAERVVYKNGFSIYRDHETIPIEVVAESLGLNLRKDGTGFRLCCPCPNHDDSNPSAVITTDTNKYENTFKCWSCGEHGGVLELVAAVEYGIQPSKYRDVLFDKEKKYTPEEHAKMRQVRDKAARYIDRIFPGSIDIVNPGEKQEQTDALIRPEVPPEIWAELKRWLNISRNVGASQHLLRYPNPETMDDRRAKNADMTVRKIQGLDDMGYAELMYNKLDELQRCYKDYKKQIMSDFPDLDTMAEVVITRGVTEKIEMIEPVKEAFRVYLVALGDAEALKNQMEDYLYDDLDDPKEL